MPFKITAAVGPRTQPSKSTRFPPRRRSARLRHRTRELWREWELKKGIQEKESALSPQHGSKSAANQVKKSATTFPLSHQPRQGLSICGSSPRHPLMQGQKSPDGPEGWAAFSNFRSTQAVASVTPPWDPGPEIRGDGRRRPTGRVEIGISGRRSAA